MSQASPGQHGFQGKVLYIARAPFVSGAERALMSMLRHLDRTRVEPMLVAGHDTELVDLAKALNIPVHVIALPKRGKLNMLAWWRSLGALRKVIEKFGPDVMHANDVPSCQAMSVIGAKLRVARVIHVRWVITADDAAWWARRGAETAICISDWVRRELGDTTGTALASSHIEVLRDSVDWPALPANAPVASPIETIDDGALKLGFAGQLIESKGLDLVIEAMGKLPAGRRPRLYVAGEDTQTGGAYKQQLEKLAETHGVANRIVWLGFLKDVAALQQAVDVMVCPSRIEPLGLVPLEAARFAVPTVANRVGGLAESIIDGETGRLVDPAVDAWANALSQLPPRDVLTQWGQAVKRRTREHDAPMVYQQRLMDIYTRACDAARHK